MLRVLLIIDLHAPHILKLPPRLLAVYIDHVETPALRVQGAIGSTDDLYSLTQAESIPSLPGQPHETHHRHQSTSLKPQALQHRTKNPGACLLRQVVSPNAVAKGLSMTLSANIVIAWGPVRREQEQCGRAASRKRRAQ